MRLSSRGRDHDRRGYARGRHGHGLSRRSPKGALKPREKATARAKRVFEKLSVYDSLQKGLVGLQCRSGNARQLDSGEA